MECKSSSLQNLRTKIHKQVNYKIMLLDRLKYISISVVQYDEGPTKLSYIGVKLCYHVTQRYCKYKMYI